MLTAQHLHKSYAGRTAVEDVSLDLRPGEIIGLLGPNGAGKTTTVSMIAGLATPGRGTVALAGVPVLGDTSPAKKRIGVVPQELALFDGLPALDNVLTFGALYGIDTPTLKARAAEALALVGLSERAKDKPSTFSGGMKRRLNLACALVHDPAVLLLDEPTVGVDPQSRNAIFDNLETLKARGMAMLYTTHYMEEAERLCDRVIIMDAGKVIAEDALVLLRDRQAASASLDLTLDRAWPGAVPAGVDSAGERNWRVTVGAIERDLPPLLAQIQAAGLRVQRIESSRATLESLFLELTGRKLRDD
ncbi:MAG: ABC transporter ATP-binding protein [Betaproteobacteria bacterium]|nr:ABC transporter ATP-binding protein [Betaproteobacteria bacterium]